MSALAPTVFSDVPTDSALWREEIFGPVLVVRSFATEAEAIALANDSDYGLAAYVSGEDLGRLRELAGRLRAGQVILNGAGDITAPFGGYRMSGNGREWGRFGFDEFVEVKAILGYGGA